MSSDGFFTAVTVIIQQLLVHLDVSGGQEDEVRRALYIMQFGLKVSIFTVVDQSAQTVAFFGSINTRKMYKEKQLYLESREIICSRVKEKSLTFPVSPGLCPKSHTCTHNPSLLSITGPQITWFTSDLALKHMHDHSLMSEHKHSPVGFVVVAEIVHVAARRGVLSVLRLSCFGIRNL